MKNLLKNPRLFVQEEDTFKEIEHVEDHAKRLNITRSTINTRRVRGKLKEESIEVRGGYYFYKEENKND